MSKSDLDDLMSFIDGKELDKLLTEKDADGGVKTRSITPKYDPSKISPADFIKLSEAMGVSFESAAKALEVGVSSISSSLAKPKGSEIGNTYTAEQLLLAEKHPEASSLVSKLRKILKEIDGIDGERKSFTVAGPAIVTVARSEHIAGVLRSRVMDVLRIVVNDSVFSAGISNYRKKPVIGGERLIPFDAYIGKKGATIIRFYENPYDSGEMRTFDTNTFIELDWSDANELLEDFHTFYETEVGDLDEREGENSLAAVLDSFRLAADTDYGSW